MISNRVRPPLLLVLAAALVAGACDPTGPGRLPSRIQLSRSLSPGEARVAAASSDFAVDLLKAVAAQDTASNVFLSPLSLSMALGMTMNGAAGETWTQMRDGLGFDGMDETEINASYHDLIGLLVGLDRRVEMEIANSVWAEEGYPFYDDFIQRVRDSFDAAAQQLDFAAPGAADVMNGWVADATHDRITDLISAIDPNAIMYLLNAVYFNGEWRRRFDPADTRTGTFTRADGRTVSVPMMHGDVGLRTLWDGGAVGVELPYGGDAFSAIAILPPADESIRDFVSGLTSERWTSWMADFDEQAEADDGDGDGMMVVLPKIELTYERGLNGDLAGLGMTDMFDEVQADFTRLTPTDLPAGEGPPYVFVTEVKQKTFLKVDERGTEAAVATSVAIGVTSAPPSLVFNRPFLFAIRERLTGTVLFLGIIGDPSVHP